MHISYPIFYILAQKLYILSKLNIRKSSLTQKHYLILNTKSKMQVTKISCTDNLWTPMKFIIPQKRNFLRSCFANFSQSYFLTSSISYPTKWILQTTNYRDNFKFFYPTKRISLPTNFSHSEFECASSKLLVP